MYTRPTLRRLFFTTLSFLIVSLAHSQEIEFRKHIVYVDGKECLQIKSSGPNNISFLNMQGEELFFLKYTNTQVTNVRYCKVIFLKQRKQLTSSNYMFLQKMLVKKLINSGAIKDCALVDDKVDEFIMKYDEHVE